MKTKKIITFLLVLVIILSVGLVFTTIKLINTTQALTNTPSKNNDEIDIVIKPIEVPNKDKSDVDPVNVPKSNTNENNNIDKEPNEPIENAPKDNSNKVKGIEDEKKPQNNENDNAKDKNNKNNKSNNSGKNDKSILNLSIISKDEAIKIGMKKVGSGGELKKITPELDENPPKYYVDILKNKHKYEIVIHARTGAILEHEKIKVKD